MITIKNRLIISILCLICLLFLSIIPVFAKTDNEICFLDMPRIDIYLPFCFSTEPLTYRYPYRWDYYRNVEMYIFYFVQGYIEMGGPIFSGDEDRNQMYEKVKNAGWNVTDETIRTNFFNAKKKYADEPFAPDRNYYIFELRKEINEMPLVSIIKECNIPREALEIILNRMKWYTEQFSLDLDLIYSFDNEKINAYYKYTPFDPWEENGERRWRFAAYSFGMTYSIIRFGEGGVMLRDTAREVVLQYFDENGHFIGNADEMPAYKLLPKRRSDYAGWEEGLLSMTAGEAFFKNNDGTEYGERPNYDILLTDDYELIDEFYSVKNRAMYGTEKDNAICSAVINYLAANPENDVESIVKEENGTLRIEYKSLPGKKYTIDPDDFWITAEKDDAVRIKYCIFGEMTDTSTEIYQKGIAIDLVKDGDEWKVVDNAFPDTGENTAIVIYSSLALVSLLGMGWVLFRKRASMREI